MKFRIFMSTLGSVMGLSVALTGIVPYAHAQSSETPQGKRIASFQAADANHDGHISPDEFYAFVHARMASASGMRAAMFSHMDPETQKAKLSSRFSQMDAGSKGYLTLDDWRQQS